jgi:2-polyprenylphenol 6-hydroxylase
MRPFCDVVINGGGLVGLSLARALAGSGLSLALIEREPPPISPARADWDSRIYAISPGVAAFLERGGAWARLPQERVARVEAMRIYGDDARACLEFDAYEAGVRELAFIVENRELQFALWESLREQEISMHCPANWATLEFEPECAILRLDAHAELACRLVVGADGAESRTRAAAGIAAIPADYGQLGIVANFSCERPHRNVAWQWFRRDGVLALLPLPGGRVSMVWSIAAERARRLLELTEVQLAQEVETASRGMLGELHLVTAPAAFPLKLQRVKQFTRPRVALIGDAAHNVHPLAGQGVNLGFRDARELAQVLCRRAPFQDCGDRALLRQYERARKEDVAVMQWATDGLQKLFNNEAVTLSRARNWGLDLVNRQPLLKDLLVRHAVA